MPYVEPQANPATELRRINEMMESLSTRCHWEQDSAPDMNAADARERWKRLMRRAIEINASLGN